MPDAPDWFHPTVIGVVHVAVAAFGLLFYVALRRRGRQYRTAPAALAWVMGMVAFPYLALPLFFLFGRRKERRPSAIEWPRANAPAVARNAWIDRIAAAEDLPPRRAVGGLELHASGEQALAGLLALLDRARHDIALSIFIFSGDAAGEAVMSRLVAAAARGVQVRVLLDGIGSATHARRLRRAMHANGIQAEVFGAIRGLSSLATGNLRNHRKFAVADGRWLWGGGRNIADDYFGTADAPGWIDLSYVLEGPLAGDALALFNRQWGAAATPAPPASAASADALLVPSGPDFANDTAYDLLLQAIHRADARIHAASPYFVPDDAFLHALVMAARRGVDITLLLPAYSNHAIADVARHRSLRELAAAGARILLLPRMCHAKLVLVDDAFALSGSLNLDTRSFFLNYELSCLFQGEPECVAHARWFDAIRASAQSYRPQPPGMLQDLYEGAVRAIAFQL